MRAEIVLGGVDPGPLGSFRDKTLRTVLTKMKIAESHKLMVLTTATTNNIDSTRKNIRSYNAAVWYEDHTKNSYKAMEEYYMKYMKQQEVFAKMNEDGSIHVTGLT